MTRRMQRRRAPRPRGRARRAGRACPRLGPGEVLLRTRAALTCGTDVKVFRRGYHARMITAARALRPRDRGSRRGGGAGRRGRRARARASWWPTRRPAATCGYCRDDRASLCDDLLFWNGAYAEFARIPARIVEHNLAAARAGRRLPGGGAWSSRSPASCAGIEASRVRAGQTVAVIGAGRDRPDAAWRSRACAGAHVDRRGAQPGPPAPRRASWARRRRSTPTPSRGRRGAPAARRTRRPAGPDVVIEAAGLAETAEAAIRAVRKGGLVNLFAGCPADARVALDAQRLHYEELTVTSTFHHTPESFREAYRLIADGRVDPTRSSPARRRSKTLPEVLRRMARGRRRPEDRDPALGPGVGPKERRGRDGRAPSGGRPSQNGARSYFLRLSGLPRGLLGLPAATFFLRDLPLRAGLLRPPSSRPSSWSTFFLAAFFRAGLAFFFVAFRMARPGLLDGLLDVGSDDAARGRERLLGFRKRVGHGRLGLGGVHPRSGFVLHAISSSRFDAVPARLGAEPRMSDDCATVGEVSPRPPSAVKAKRPDAANRLRSVERQTGRQVGEDAAVVAQGVAAAELRLRAGSAAGRTRRPARCGRRTGRATRTGGSAPRRLAKVVPMSAPFRDRVAPSQSSSTSWASKRFTQSREASTRAFASRSA